MAEAHGNRTHPPNRNRPGTTVLKTAGGTSPRALPAAFYSLVRASPQAMGSARQGAPAAAGGEPAAMRSRALPRA
jgi:hypothetical protein